MKKSTLRLRREVIRNLSGSSLGGVAGALSLGCPPTRFLCPTDLLTLCNCNSDMCGSGGGTSVGCPNSQKPNDCQVR